MLRVGVIGMGFGAKVHLPVFLEREDVLVTGLADAGSGSAGEQASKYALDAKIFSDGNALASWSGVDAVSIATPATKQASIVGTAIAHGKHVLCEKPFGANLVEIQELTKAVKNQNITAALSYQFRYDSGIRRLIELVNTGAIGNPKRINVSWLVSSGLDSSRLWSWRDDEKSAGGVLIDWCSHSIDYVGLCLGKSVSKVFCSVKSATDSRVDKFGRNKSVSAPDICDLRCTFSNDTVGQFYISRVDRFGDGHRIDVHGDLGTLVYHHRPPFKSDSKTLKLTSQGMEQHLDILEYPIPKSGDERISAFSRLVDEFIVAATGGVRSSLLPKFSDGEFVWKIISSARHSIERQEIIFL